jgi:DNA-binding MarR family transcriptional regulator
MRDMETPARASESGPASARTGAPRVAYTEAGAALFHLLRELETSLPLLSQLPVSPGRMALLRSLALRGPRNLSELARERGVSRQGVQRLAEALEAEGLAESQPDPRNVRARRLALSEAGLAAYRDLALHEARELNALAAALPPDDLRTATRVLRLLAGRERR